MNARKATGEANELLEDQHRRRRTGGLVELRGQLTDRSGADGTQS